MKTMTGFLLAAALAVSATGAFSTRAQAQNYPWCAVYGSPAGGTNCGFTTFEQCRTTISGIGGFCEPNTQYVPPPGPSRRRNAY